MKRIYNLTKSDYANLFSGNVAYLIQCYECNNQIVKKIEDYIRNIFLKHKSYTHTKTHSPQKYQIVVSTGKAHNPPVWGEKGMQSFIEEKNLQPGDEVTIYCLHPNSNGGYWCAGGGIYKIQKEGWITVDKFRGE